MHIYLILSILDCNLVKNIHSGDCDAVLVGISKHEILHSCRCPLGNIRSFGAAKCVIYCNSIISGFKSLNSTKVVPMTWSLKWLPFLVAAVCPTYVVQSGDSLFSIAQKFDILSPGTTCISIYSVLHRFCFPCCKWWGNFLFFQTSSRMLS